MAPTKRSAGLKPASKKSANAIIGGRTQKQREERPAKDARLLDAVNGIVSASKLRPGQGPIQGAWDPHDPRLIHPCSICGRRFERRYHVKVHMAPCVKRNGNPNGVRWDNAWNNAQVDDADNDDDPDNNDNDEEMVVEEEKEEEEEDDDNDNDEEMVVEEEEEEEEEDDDDNDNGAEASTDSEESESRKQSEELEVLDSPPDSPVREHSITGNSPVDLPSASSSPAPPSPSPALPSSSLVPSSSQQSSPNLQHHHDPPVDSLAGYEPSLRFDILANDGLMMIVDAWNFFYFHQRLRQGNMGTHPQLERVMEELQIRGIAHEHRSWISGAMHRAWTLDLEGVDMRYVRVRSDSSGS